jgi:hypothetical protein
LSPRRTQDNNRELPDEIPPRSHERRNGDAAISPIKLADQSVLATAAKYASDKPALIRFMRDMG